MWTHTERVEEQSPPCWSECQKKPRVLSVRHFSPMPESVELTSGTSSANGCFSKADKTTWRSHSGILRCSTGLPIRKLRNKKAICGSLAGSYFQWRSTEAMDVLCEIMVPGWKPLSNKSKNWKVSTWHWKHSVPCFGNASQSASNRPRTLFETTPVDTGSLLQRHADCALYSWKWPSKSPRVKI